MIFWKTEEKYFCAEGWTGQIRLILLTKIAVLAQRFSVFSPGVQPSAALLYNCQPVLEPYRR